MAPPTAPGEPEPSVSGYGVGMLLIAVLTVAFAAAILMGATAYTRETVGSTWEDIPMSCDTQRFERDDGAFELFTCRALAGGRLPPGVYESPDARWRSDLTGEDARGNVIRIAPNGDLAGVAAY